MWIFNSYIMPFVILFVFLFGCFYQFKKTVSRVLVIVLSVFLMVCHLTGFFTIL